MVLGSVVPVGTVAALAPGTLRPQLPWARGADSFMSHFPGAEVPVPVAAMPGPTEPSTIQLFRHPQAAGENLNVDIPWLRTGAHSEWSRHRALCMLRFLICIRGKH